MCSPQLSYAPQGRPFRSAAPVRAQHISATGIIIHSGPRFVKHFFFSFFLEFFPVQNAEYFPCFPEIFKFPGANFEFPPGQIDSLRHRTGSQCGRSPFCGNLFQLLFPQTDEGSLHPLPDCSSSDRTLLWSPGPSVSFRGKPLSKISSGVMPRSSIGVTAPAPRMPPLQGLNDRIRGIWQELEEVSPCHLNSPVTGHQDAQGASRRRLRSLGQSRRSDPLQFPPVTICTLPT